MKRYFALFMTLLLTASLLFGCGMNSAPVDKGFAEGEAAEDALVSESIASNTGSTGTESALPEGKKLVRKLWLDAETEDLDPLLAQVDQQIADLDGYIEQREVRNNSSRSYRYANITLRIPAEHMHDFVTQVSENANVTSSNETTENITLSYVATESRIKALETEQARLLELLAKAENMENLLQIEKRLTEVRTELEKVTSQLRLYDNLVDYATIYLKLTEVKEYTPVEEPETLWQRMAEGFTKSLKALGVFFEGLAVFLVCALPWIIVPALVLTLILILQKRKNRKKNPPAEKETK